MNPLFNFPTPESRALFFSSPSLAGFFGAAIGLQASQRARLSSRFPVPARISEPGPRRGAARNVPASSSRRCRCGDSRPRPGAATLGLEAQRPALRLANPSGLPQGIPLQSRRANSCSAGETQLLAGQCAVAGLPARLCVGGETGLCRKPRGYCGA